MIASLAKSLEFQAAEVKECKAKIFGLKNEALLFRKEVDMLKDKSREKGALLRPRNFSMEQQMHFD